VQALSVVDPLDEAADLGADVRVIGGPSPIFPSALVGAIANVKAREPIANFRLGAMLLPQECLITFYLW
jgi:hypothetical protein